MKGTPGKIPLNMRESSHIEYKRSKSGLSKDIWETVSAFANTAGGTILLGYESRDDIFIPVGVEDPARLIDDFTSTVSQKFNFCPMVRADLTEDNSVTVIVIEIEEALHYQKPIYIKDAGPLKGGFKRIGASDIKLSDEDISRYYRERQGAPDAQPLPDSTVDDIDQRAFTAF